MTAKSDQYSLGLLAVEMLQGEPPVSVQHLKDLDKKKEFFENPEKLTKMMRKRAPLLADVVLRMLEDNPSQRWPSMARIVKEVGDGSSIEEVDRRLAKIGYERVRKEPEFYKKFYENLCRKRPHLKKLFDTKISSWDKQYAALDASVCSLLNFSDDQAKTDPTLLTRTAESHRKHKLKVNDFEHFQASFLLTLCEFGQKDEEIQGAWKTTLKSGIKYMKDNAT